MALGTAAVQAFIALRSYLLVQSPSPVQQPILSYISPNTLTAAGGNVLNVVVPPATNNFSINLPVLFAAFTLPIFVSIADVSNPGVGFTWSTVSAGVKQSVGAAGFLAWLANGSTALQPIFVDNPSATANLVLQIGVMSN